MAKYSTKLANQRVLILGGTSGLGYAVAEAALESGAHITISSSSQTKLDKTVARLKEAFPAQSAAQTITTHVTNLADIDNLETNLESLFQAATNAGTLKLNHVLSTAGDNLQIAPITQITPETITKALGVRFIAPTLIAKLIPKYLEQSVSSSFTLTGGSIAHKPSPGWSVIGAVSSALEGLTRGLALELKPVRVNLVHPGTVSTELFSSIVPADQFEAVMEQFRGKTTTGTVGEPEDLAESYLYLMKDRYSTGQIVHPNGGSLLV